jgi:transposase
MESRHRSGGVPADAARDADAIRRRIETMGAPADIPGDPSRTARHPFDRALREERRPIGCRLGRLGRFERVALRSETTARNHLAAVTMAAIVPWIR